MNSLALQHLYMSESYNRQDGTNQTPCGTIIRSSDRSWPTCLSISGLVAAKLHTASKSPRSRQTWCDSRGNRLLPSEFRLSGTEDFEEQNPQVSETARGHLHGEVDRRL